MSAIAARVACVAEPTCGTTTRFGRVQQRMVGGERLGIGHVEAGAGDLALGQRASSSASVSTIGPRAVFTR